MQCACRESEFDSELLGNVHYLQQDVLTLSQLGSDVSDLKKEVNQDIETAVAEIVETHPDVVLVGHRMLGKEPLDPTGELLELFAGRIISDLYDKPLAAHRAGREVFDRGAD